MRVKCPECVKTDQRSVVYSEGGSSTLMDFSRYWDEDGVAHLHDPNTHTNNYRCSKGHKWSDSFIQNCIATGCTYGESL